MMKFFSPEMLNKNKLKGKHICHYKIGRKEVEQPDFQRVDAFMADLASYGSLARQRVLFSFSGYDKDPRELIFIGEVISYVKAFLSRYPYFWYYAIPYNSEFFYLALFFGEKETLIADDPAKRSFYVNQDVEKVKRLVNTIGINLNIYGEEIGDIEGAADCLKIWGGKITGVDIKAQNR